MNKLKLYTDQLDILISLHITVLHLIHVKNDIWLRIRN